MGEPGDAAPAQGEARSETEDKVENETNKLVCSGKMSLGEAQQRIATDCLKLGKEEGVS